MVFIALPHLLPDGLSQPAPPVRHLGGVAKLGKLEAVGTSPRHSCISVLAYPHAARGAL
jgi:hypothetical protein